MTTHSKIKTQEIDSEVGAGPRRDTIGYRTSQPSAVAAVGCDVIRSYKLGRFMF